MQPRTTPRNIPDKPHYLTIDLEGVGPTSWRIPSMVKAARILSMLQESGVMEAAAAAETGEEIIANLGDRLPALFACQGALLGVCWFHTTQDLDTPIPVGALAAYGEAVFEELHEEGWALGHIQTVFVDLVQRVVDGFITQKEVAEKVDFLAQPAAKEN